MQNFRQRVETELRSNILPFWLKHAVDEQYGGFRGQMSNDLTIDPLAPKGLILNARILWTFSKAFSVYPKRPTCKWRAGLTTTLRGISGTPSRAASSGWWIISVGRWKRRSASMARRYRLLASGISPRHGRRGRFRQSASDLCGY